jgi:CBS domain-containing protein
MPSQATHSKTKALQETIGHLESTPFATVEPKASLKEVYATMQKAGVGCVLVCKGSKLLGIFSERDVVLKTLGDELPATPIEKLMTPDPVTATVDTTVGEAVELMHGRGFRNLPILDDKKRPIGLLTVNRIIKYLAALFPAEVYNLPPKPDQVDESADGA